MVEAVKIASCLMNEVDAGAEKLIGKGKEASVQLGVWICLYFSCVSMTLLVEKACVKDLK